MGIKGLWTVLTPFSEKKSLHEIRGEVLAVDLAGWVCDSQNVTDYHIQPKLYLRNLFFRTIYLLLADVEPIFVLDGDAPELKRDVMATRNAIQFRGAAPRSEAVINKQPDVRRKRFSNVLKECETLLKSMGVRCIKGKGEAEATCAQLNAQGLVHAVVSQDSDCFAYGARRVYRNFSVSSASGGGAMQGSIDCYDAEKMFQSNGFGRNKMVALALLCGCDYGLGACGSSITTVLSYLHTISEKDIISRLVSWVSDPEQYEEKSRWASAPGRCDRCGHVGRTHAKNGCPVCATHRGCDEKGHKSKVSTVKRELALRTRALSCGVPFPEPKVMKEFLDDPRETIDVDTLKKPCPSLIQFVKLMSSKLDWSEKYSVQKFLPLLTKWHFQDNVAHKTIQPVKIKKKRNPKGVPSYEVQWADIDGQYEALISDDQFEEDEDRTAPWTTTERQDLLRKYYPDIVEAYEESIKKPPKENKSGRRRKNDAEEGEKPKRKYNRKVKKLNEKQIENLTNSIRNCDLINKTLGLNSSKPSVKVVKLKRKLKSGSNSKGQKTLNSFIACKKRRCSKMINSLRDSFKNMSLNCENNTNMSTDIKGGKILVKKKSNHLLNMFKSASDSVHGSDLSDIVDDIVAKAPVVKTAKLDQNVVKLVFNKHSTPRKSVFRNSALIELHYNCSTPQQHSNKTNTTSEINGNTSYFFDKFSEHRDAFELSVENHDCKYSISAVYED
ncbi:flap endonuclease GEN [Leguminivora glycinivorella]|uniref:flap endonuclease GEN n=1 Tax=Leguminivora glycinivorella TaxID=1035111 RepID=UPI00200D2CAB|nr:flap endonuclease GEN [Leguminivora glycinivorella]